MMTDRSLVRTLGTEPPILADGHRAPDRREISLRWLSGTFLTGITSCILMGVALFAALDGRQQLAIPAEAYAATGDSASAGLGTDEVSRGGRLLAPKIAARPVDKAILEVSTVTHDGEREVVRRQPFAHVKMRLAANYKTQDNYPGFDPLAIFATDEKSAPAAVRTGTIYGSDVESEVSLKTTPFPVSGNTTPYAGAMSFDEVEENVRTNGSVLTDGSTQVAALYYIDPQRFDSEANVDIAAGLAARVVDQNMSVAEPEIMTPQTPEYADDILPVRRPQEIEAVLTSAG